MREIRPQADSLKLGCFGGLLLSAAAFNVTNFAKQRLLEARFDNQFVKVSGNLSAEDINPIKFLEDGRIVLRSASQGGFPGDRYLSFYVATADQRSVQSFPPVLMQEKTATVAISNSGKNHLIKAERGARVIVSDCRGSFFAGAIYSKGTKPTGVLGSFGGPLLKLGSAGTFSSVRTVNSKGQAVAVIAGPGPITRAFDATLGAKGIKLKEFKLSDGSPLKGLVSSAYLSESGALVGTMKKADKVVPIVVNEKRELTELSIPCGFSTAYPTYIDKFHRVCGFGMKVCPEDAADEMVALYWDNDGTVHSLQEMVPSSKSETFKVVKAVEIFGSEKKFQVLCTVRDTGDGRLLTRPYAVHFER